MSDFSSLCPLFNTGMYSEITLPTISAVNRSTTERVGGIPFSRSVIVTHAYIAKMTTFATTCTAVKIALARAATFAATRTVFATVILSGTATTQKAWKYLPFTVTAKTFSATQVLMVKFLKKDTARNVSIIVRYKEK